MYSRYLQTGNFIQQPEHASPSAQQNPTQPRLTPQAAQAASPFSALRIPFLSQLPIDSSDLLIILILLLLMKEEDNTTILIAIGLYFFM